MRPEPVEGQRRPGKHPTQSGRMPFARLEHWQTRYMIVYFVWAWIVVLAFPLVFSFA